eukprot:m.405998 g.405998  ORF g.405998 m.405998 type:complete len:788 (-) comp16795_c3_seq54:201-2564(-)
MSVEDRSKRAAPEELVRPNAKKVKEDNEEEEEEEDTRAEVVPTVSTAAPPKTTLDSASATQSSTVSSTTLSFDPKQPEMWTADGSAIRWLETTPLWKNVKNVQDDNWEDLTAKQLVYHTTDRMLDLFKRSAAVQGALIEIKSKDPASEAGPGLGDDQPRKRHRVTAGQFEGTAYEAKTAPQRYWSSMWVAEITNDVLSLGTHALLKSIKNEWAYHSMFVRRDDATMVDQLFKFQTEENIRKFALSGTPGIGKTLIRNYLVWRLVKQLKETPTPTVIALHSSGDGAQHDVLALEFHGMQEDGSPSLAVSLWDPRTFQSFMDETTEVDFIQLNDISKGDSSALCESSNTVLRVRISSENDKSYKEWLKTTATTGAVHLHMFPWSIDDLKAARSQCASEVLEETLEQRFHKYGGIPRVVFAATDEGEAQYVSNSIETAITSLDFGAVDAAQLFGQVRSERVRHGIMYIVRPNDEIAADGKCKHGDDCHRARCSWHVIGTQWISAKVAKKLVEQKVRELNTVVGSMWPPADSRCVQGVFMESIAHQLLAYGGEFSAANCVLLSGGKKKLTRGGKKALRLPSVENWDWAVNEGEVVRFIKEHRNDGTAGYIRPVAGNFPAIDSVFVLPDGDVLLTNSTIQRNHPITGPTAVETFTNLCNAATEDLGSGENTRIFMLWIVSSERHHSTFSKQVIGGDHSTIQQYRVNIRTSPSVSCIWYVTELDTILGTQRVSNAKSDDRRKRDSFRFLLWCGLTNQGRARPPHNFRRKSQRPSQTHQDKARTTPPIPHSSLW